MLFAQRVDNHVKEIKVVQEILGCGLGLSIVGDDLIEMQQFHSVRIGEGWSNHTLFKGLALSLGKEELGRQLANVWRVVLDTDLFGFAVYLDMGIETAVVIDAGFKGDREALILKESGKKDAPLSCGNDPLGHAEQFAHR